MTIGEKIKLARKRAGLTQKELGEKLNVSQSAIGQFESDKSNPNLKTIRKIAEALDIPLSELVDNWGRFSQEEIIEDYEGSNKVTPLRLITEIDDSYGDKLNHIKELLLNNPGNAQIRNQTEQLLNDIAIQLGSKNSRDFTYTGILSNLDVLNEQGLVKVLSFTDDLILLKKYIRDKRVNELTEIPKYQKKGENTHILVNAAHARTDIEVTEEMKKHDDDIMNDEDF